MQQNKLKLTISRIEFRAMTGVGAGISIELKNRTERPIKATAEITLQSGEVLQSFGDEIVPSEAKREILVSLVLRHKKPHSRPQITTIKLHDSVDRLLFVSKNTIERLNDQILNGWPFSESEEEE
jgi:hypothetical protein